MPTGRKVYILTENNQIKGATYSVDAANNWLGLGQDYDYTPLIPDETGTPGELPAEQSKEQPSKAIERSQRVTEDADALRKRIENKIRKFRPNSSLLKGII